MYKILAGRCEGMIALAMSGRRRRDNIKITLNDTKREGQDRRQYKNHS
jgi:hypothetical protein